jgi:hypothetical protein
MKEPWVEKHYFWRMIIHKLRESLLSRKKAVSCSFAIEIKEVPRASIYGFRGIELSMGDGSRF